MKRIVLFFVFMVLVSSCAFKKYECENGYTLRASFDEKEVRWSLRNKDSVINMTPVSFSGEGLYKKKGTTLQYFEGEKVIIDSPEMSTSCYLKK